MPKMALYEKWSFRKLDKYGYTDLALPTIAISVFEANKEGLEAAAKMASRPDAVLVKLNNEFYKGELLKKYVEGKVQRGKCVHIFKPTNAIPRS